MPQAELKRPLIVYIMACLFILAPIINILISFITQSSVFIDFLKSISMLDWIWLGLLFTSGFFLFKAHKTSWALAALSLFFVLGVNIYRSVSGGPIPNGAFVQWVSSLATVAALFMLFYFRFPYLDRRAQWLFPTAHRYDFQTPVEVVAQDIFLGVTESISVSGVRIRLQRDMEGSSTNLRFVDVIFPDIRNIKVKGRVVEYRDNVLRLKFKDLSRKDRGYIHDWFRSQIETQSKVKI